MAVLRWPPPRQEPLCYLAKNKKNVSARVTHDVTCYPQASAYEGRRSFCHLQHRSRLGYQARHWIWRTRRVLSLFRSRSAVFFESITCSQKETSEFQAFSLRNMAAIMLLNERTPTLIAAMRWRAGSLQAGHTASVWSIVSTFWPSKWWYSGVIKLYSCYYSISKLNDVLICISKARATLYSFVYS